ncbi:uncharacterized protein LOC122856383 [Aphidius gifuensis]|uniref:uncharacterized protein LOC122856383 n=1 Tax=Aphidius gifuensis TaxID=684658 RepID=UPI001CDBEE3E|nr:uncharacterized protein LOC122856383 [Aphidius gifuensis]
MNKRVRNILKKCDTCQRVKYLNKNIEGDYGHVSSESRGDLVTVDYYGSLPKSRVKNNLTRGYKVRGLKQKNNKLEDIEIEDLVPIRVPHISNLSDGLDETWQANLVDMQAYTSVNRNYKYFLTIIDIFSKFAWAIPRKSKTGKDVTAAMKSVLDGRIPQKLHIGDKVRISKYKTVFEKGYTPNFTTEIFTIKEVKYTDPVTYKLIDYKNNPIEGGFYEEELTEVKYPDIYLVEKIVKKRGDKLYVKWLSFDDTHNSWINKSDL